MKKFKFLTALLVASMLIFAPSSALAAQTTDTQVEVQINGEDIAFTDVKPVIVNNRVFVPFRTIFEELDAEIEYDGATKTVTAVKDNTTVTLVVGDKTISVATTDENGAVNTQTIETDAASFISNSRTLVPVRFVAQALDCTVGWDAANKTAIIVENNLFNTEDVTFEIVNKYLAYSTEFAKSNYAITGEINLDAEISFPENIKFSGTTDITGLTSAKTINLDTTTTLDLTDLRKLAESEGTLSEEDLAMFDEMSEIDMNIIFDLEDGKFYIGSTSMSSLTGEASDEETWILLDMKKLLAETGMNYSELLLLNDTTDFAEIMNTMAKTIPVDNKYMTASTIESYKMLIDLFADSSFTKSGNEYTSSYTLSEQGSTFTMTMVIIESGNKITGSKIDMSVGMTGMGEIMTMSVVENGLNSTINMDINAMGMAKISMDGEMNYSKTTQNPITAPKSTNVIDIMDLLLF